MPVTVVLDFEKPPSYVSYESMRGELDRLLNDAGVRLDLRLRTEIPADADFPDVVVFKMKGSCTMKSLPVGAVSDERGPLAMAYSQDGQNLHFGEVECDRVRQSLQRIVGRGSARKYEPAFGNALGLVLAHEMYHILANSKLHTKDGVTKASLSARELLLGDLEPSRHRSGSGARR